VNRFNEEHGGHWRHHETVGAAPESLGVCPEVAHADLAVLAAKGLAALEERHAIM
jgi:hypothetical protein